MPRNKDAYNEAVTFSNANKRDSNLKLRAKLQALSILTKQVKILKKPKQNKTKKTKKKKPTKTTYIKIKKIKADTCKLYTFAKTHLLL